MFPEVELQHNVQGWGRGLLHLMEGGRSLPKGGGT